MLLVEGAGRDEVAGVLPGVGPWCPHLDLQQQGVRECERERVRERDAGKHLPRHTAGTQQIHSRYTADMQKTRRRHRRTTLGHSTPPVS